MRTTAFVLALLAALAAASPGRRPHHHQPPHHPYESVCTVTKYTSTKTHSVTSTATATVTTTTTSTTLPTISNCVAPEVKISKRDKPKYKPTSHGCWETITISRVSTLTTTVASTTITTTATSTATSVAAFGPFSIYDAISGNSFSVQISSADGEDVFVAPQLLATDPSEFTLALGAITVSAATSGEGSMLYADPSYAVNSVNAPQDTVFAFGLGEVSSGASLLSCSVSQNEDGTCPLTCTGNGGTNFYYCSATSEPIVQIGDLTADSEGECSGYGSAVTISAYAVTPDLDCATC